MNVPKRLLLPGISDALLGYGLLRFRAIPAFEVVKFSHIMDCDNLC
jgi:hypothetical protein